MTLAKRVKFCRMDYAGQFSVVIPTLQRSDDLRTIVDQCAAHPLVAEVLVINNATDALTFDSPKVRVLDQGRNIYVNPAWNLGAREARAEFPSIINDDILFEDGALTHAQRALRSRRFGVIGPAQDAFNRPAHGRRRVKIAPFFSFKGSFGTFMCLRRADYNPIPEEMRIWGGDDWLFLTQSRPNGVLSGYRFDTEMGTSSGSPEFQALRAAELASARPILMPLYRTRWWHRPVEYLDRIRRFRKRFERSGYPGTQAPTLGSK
ncbi:glycosyltransferase family 2 protein [Brachybacterium muris]|uniref:glycosyltransferase family 2 protein n=1 Tax=Brachybacterium muris TaxID=219301 RepID=UPI0012371B49|nr:glycosyltransferase [Brachybacterium muris]